MAEQRARRDSNFVTTLIGVDSIGFTDATTAAVNPSTHALLVEASFSPPALQDVNLTQVGGVAVALGQTTMSASLPITIASNQSALHTIVDSGTLTAVTSITNTVTVTATNLSTNIAQIGGATVAQGHGTAAAALRVELPTDGTGVIASVGSITNALPAGNNNIGDVDVASAIITSGTITTVTTLTNVGAGNAAATIAADGVTPTVPGIAAYGFVKTPGANTWDRHYSVVNATDTTGTGIAAAGMLAQFDDTSPGTVTENRFGNVRMSVRREQYMQIRDAAGNERGVNVDANNGIPISIEAAQTLATVTTVSTLTNQSQEGGVNISLNAGAVDTGTRRVVQANGAGKTILSKAGSAASSGNNTLVVAGTNKLKVFAFSLSTTSTTAMTCIFQDGASGTAIWEVILQAGTSVSTGANLAVSPPAWLFNTGAATLLNLNLSSANAVLWSVSYFDEA